MTASYRRCATWLLQNVAYRDLTEERAFVFRGNHVCFWFSRPIQGEGESDEIFQLRKKDVLNRIPRGSTLSMFLALADECYRRCGLTQRTAARSTLRELRLVLRSSTEHK